MQARKIAPLLLLCFIASSFLVATAYARQIIVGPNVYFGYDNGTYFTCPGTYSNVSRIGGIWYFDSVPYPFPTPLLGGGGGPMMMPLKFDLKITKVPTVLTLGSGNSSATISLTSMGSIAEVYITLQVINSQGTVLYSWGESKLLHLNQPTNITIPFPVPSTVGSYKISVQINGGVGAGNKAETTFSVIASYTNTLTILILGVVIAVAVILLLRRRR